MNRLVSLALVLMVLVVGLVSAPGCGGGGTSGGEASAAIVDQLSSVQADPEFIQAATEALEASGFVVDVYQGDEITVDLYRSLSGGGYKLIVYRAHAGLLSHSGSSGQEVTRATAIFSNEPYSEDQHVLEQLDGQLAKARVGEGYPVVFAIGARFVTRSMEGAFDDTVVIMMGCNTLYLQDLAQAFVNAGASAYIGWGGLVTLDYVDQATVELLNSLSQEGVTVAQAISSTMATVGTDPYYDAFPTYFPGEAGSSTLAELTR